ncbi:MAG: ammonia-forming cytochrome c nitrite reductase subunit c552 [Planctomycetales bacterium]|nr:ammonia-forming cytochrome c nitrite reductase subunit c552 [Planctomycetales bacterium]
MKNLLFLIGIICLVAASAWLFQDAGEPPRSSDEPRSSSANSERPFVFGSKANSPAGSPASRDVAFTDEDYSNIHPDDYVGPEACAKCHAKQFEHWQTHPHSRMNLNPSATSVLGDFSGVRIDYGSGHVTFETEDEQYYMSIFVGDQLERRFRVTRTVGSRVTQMYIGLQVKGPEPKDHHAYTMEGKLPFGYWMKRKMWTPVSYFDSAYDQEAVSVAEQTKALETHQQEIKWEYNCLYCHNTYPYQFRISFGRGTGFAPEDFRFSDGTHAKQWGKLQPEDLVTLGISCESCHFGGREHVEHQKPTKYHPASPSLALPAAVRSLTNSELTQTPQHINSICTQCHCAQVTCYPNGAATWNSREALDLKSGACQQQLRCVDCHSPHLAGPHGGLHSEQVIADKCVSCHDRFRDGAKRKAHTRHEASSASCLDCHMPRVVQGLDNVIRTHHISSPTDRKMLDVGAPNACNLCHLDQSIQWTVDELNAGWHTGIRLSDKAEQAYGELDRPLGEAWLNHAQPLVRLIASDAMARSETPDAVAQLLPLLKDPYAVNRIFGLFAIEQKLGRRLTEQEYAPLAPHAVRDAMVDALLEQPPAP